MIKSKTNNYFGGKSYFVSCYSELNELPSEYREIVSALDVEALKNHDAFFSTLGNKCCFEPMKSWLHLVAATERVSLTVYMDDMGQKASLINTLGGSICLTPTLVPEHASIRLRDVFGIVGAIYQAGFAEPCVLQIGLHDTIERFDENMLEYSSGPPPESYVTEFYRADCGERLLAVGDQAYHYHIGGSVCPAQSLDETLSEYFKELSGIESFFSPLVPYDKVKRKSI